MRDLDNELRKLLRREQPPAGLAERVVRRAQDVDIGAASRPGFIAAPLRWAAAAVLVAALAGALQYRAIRQERVAGEAAKQQVLQALEIAGAKLAVVQAKINRLHAPSTEARE